MIIDIIHSTIIFLFCFSILSLLYLTFTFIKALLSNPPKKIELERRDLIYYGICLSFLITTLFNI